MIKELNATTVESSELVEQTFNFWFNRADHIRSPFPQYIQPELRTNATERFYKWVAGLDEKAKEEVNDELIGEKFEEIIFETALGLVQTEDERITINYPFLPRIGDKMKDENNPIKEESVVIDRSITKKGDEVFLNVKLEGVSTKKRWETDFELPI